MPSTYSSRLRLELQATGENRITWGNKANNVFSRIEDAIAGYAAITMTDANRTLTTANGNSDEARNQIILLVGTNTAVRTLTIPSVSKTYIIRNATSGGFAVTVSNGTNSISIAQGSWAYIWTDGTNIYTQDLSNYALKTDIDDLSGVTDAATSRTNLGLGTMAVQSANAVAITGGSAALTSVTSSTAIPISSGGTGGSTAEQARANLGLGSLSVVPTGTVLPFAGNLAPDGYLFCAGQTISRTTYADLFATIGTIYGAGNGTTTFALPDLRGRAVAGKDNMGGTSSNRIANVFDGDVLGATGGSETHPLTEAQLAAHSHTGTAASAGLHSHTGTTSSEGAHTHTVSGTAASAGAHTHTLGDSGDRWSTTGSSNFGTTGAYSMTSTAPTIASAGAHTHTVTGTAASAGAHTHDVTVASNGAHTHTLTIAATGSGTPHPNVQPTIILNYIIRT